MKRHHPIVMLSLLVVLCIPVKTVLADPNPDAVLARVNGKPVYARDVEANLPQDDFSVSQDEMRTTKLERLIEAEAARQFFQVKNIAIPDQAVDAAMADYEKTPPPAGCSCCRYASLQEFLDTNGSTRMEFREAVRNTKAMDLYLEQQWQSHHPTEASRTKIVNEHRVRIVKEYAKVSQIFFNTFQQASYKENPDATEKKAKQKATAAWKRLEAGEAFAAVARAVSEDAMSRDAGGALGCIDRRSFGDEVRLGLSRTPAGIYTKPIESPWGFHIVRWEKMNDADIENVLKQQFTNQAQQATMDTIMKKTKVVRYAKKAAASQAKESED